MYDRNERATNIATSATVGALLDTLVARGVLTNIDAFNILSIARKGLAPFASEPDIDAACKMLTAASSGFAQKG